MLPAGATVGDGAFVVGETVVSGPAAAIHRGRSSSGTPVLVTVAARGDASAFTADVRDPAGLLARLLHVGRVDGTGLPAIVEQEPAGAPLDRWFAEAVDLDSFSMSADRLCWALDSLHETGRVAGQLQPRLIYQSTWRGPARVSGLVAWGPAFLAACLGDDAARSALDHDLATLAPEVLDGAPCSPASDVFSLCAVLSRWVEGAAPFVAGTRRGWYGPLALEPVREALAPGLQADPDQRPTTTRLAVALGDACRERHPVGRRHMHDVVPTPVPAPARPRGWRTGDVIGGLYRIEPVVEDGELRPAHLSGGMGLVYRMRHLAWGVDLAVKVPRAELFANEEQRRRFEREVETWVSLGLHPNVVACHYLRRIDGLPCVFADYRPGGTVASAIAEGRLTGGDPRTALATVLDLCIQIAWGLAHAHRAGVVHQDVKPGNVLLDGDVAQVSDFGLAQARGVVAFGAGSGTGADLPPDRSIVVPGSGGLTPAYASPEQLSRGPLSVTTDVWSWAVVVLELLCGGRRWMIGPAARESLAVARGPRPVVDLLDACLDLDPARRPKDLSEVAAVLRAVWEDQEARPYPRAEPELATSLADGLSNEALSYLDLGRPADAERRWTRALAADPRHPHTTFNQGLHEWRSGRITDADLVRRLEDLRRSHEDDWLDEYLLGLVHSERMDTWTARDLLDDVVRRQPGHPAVTDALAALDAQRSPAGRRSRLVGALRVVRSVAISADGAYAAAGGWGGVEVWHIESGVRVAVLDRGELGARVDVRAVDIVTFDDRAVVAAAGDLPSGRSRVEVCAVDLDRFRDAVRLAGREPWEAVHLRTERSIASGGAVQSVSLDARAETVAAAGTGLSVWDVRTGTVLFEAEASTSIASMARSPDGRTIVVARTDRGTGTFVLGGVDDAASRPEEADRADAVAVAADGSQVVAGRSIRRRDGSGRVDRSLPAPVGDPRFRAIATTGDASLAMTVEAGGVLRLWDLSVGRCARTFFEAAGTLAVDVAPNGEVAVTGGDDGLVCVWQLPLGDERVPWSYAEPRAATDVSDAASAVQRAKAEAADLMAEGRHRDAATVIAAARQQPGWRRDPGLLDAWHAVGRHGRRGALTDAWVASRRTASVRHALEDALPGFQATSIPGNAIVSTPDGRRVLLARSASIQVWDGREDAPRRTLTLPPGGRAAQPDGAGGALLQPREVRSLCVTADGRLALSTAQGDAVRVWDVEAGTMTGTLADDAHTVAVAADGTVAVAAGWRSEIEVWDPRQGVRLLALRSDGVVGALAIAADGSSAVSACGRAVTVWDLGTGAPRVIETATAPVRTLALTADGRFCVAGLEGGGAELFHAQAGRRISTLEPRPGHPERSAPNVAITPDGRAVAVSGADGHLELWTVVGGDRRLLEAPGDGGVRGRALPVAVTDGATQVLAGAADGALVSWTLDWAYEFDAPT